MATKGQSTVGTQLYVLNTSVSPHVVLLIPQVKGFSPTLGGKRKKIDISNMDSAGYDENAGGRAAPPEATGEMVLDMTNTGHQAIKALFEAGAQGTIGDVELYIGNSDANGVPPTIVAGHLVPPQTTSPKHWTRSGSLVTGYIATFQPKYADDDVIRADFGFQISGAGKMSVKGDLSTKTY